MECFSVMHIRLITFLQCQSSSSIHLPCLSCQSQSLNFSLGLSLSLSLCIEIQHTHAHSLIHNIRCWGQVRSFTPKTPTPLVPGPLLLSGGAVVRSWWRKRGGGAGAATEAANKGREHVRLMSRCGEATRIKREGEDMRLV